MTGWDPIRTGENPRAAFDLPAVEGPLNFGNSEGLLYEAQGESNPTASPRGEAQCDQFDDRENLGVMGGLSEIRRALGGS